MLEIVIGVFLSCATVALLFFTLVFTGGYQFFWLVIVLIWNYCFQPLREFAALTSISFALGFIDYWADSFTYFTRYSLFLLVMSFILHWSARSFKLLDCKRQWRYIYTNYPFSPYVLYLYLNDQNEARFPSDLEIILRVSEYTLFGRVSNLRLIYPDANVFNCCSKKHSWEASGHKKYHNVGSLFYDAYQDS